MSTTIPCEVDTTPMAHEIQGVSESVRGTTEAVITMQSAVIAAESSSTQKVCSNVNRGFFTLIQSQISQKIANKQSRVEALLMQLGQQKRRLHSVKATMEREYGRIAARYIKLFTSINKELETRIRQIDQPVFELVSKHMGTASNRATSVFAMFPTTQSEGVTQSQHILVSKMKHSAQIALNQATEFLTQIGEQRKLSEQVLISNLLDNKNNTRNIPVLVFENIKDNSGIPFTQIVMPQGMSSANKNQITIYVKENLKSSWKQDAKSQLVSEEFTRILEASDTSPRVKDIMRRLYSSANFEKL